MKLHDGEVKVHKPVELKSDVKDGDWTMRDEPLMKIRKWLRVIVIVCQVT